MSFKAHTEGFQSQTKGHHTQMFTKHINNGSYDAILNNLNIIESLVMLLVSYGSKLCMRKESIGKKGATIRHIFIF